jgi:MFS family permease
MHARHWPAPASLVDNGMGKVGTRVEERHSSSDSATHEAGALWIWGLATTQLIAWGSLFYSLSLFMVPAVRELGWSTAGFSLGLSLTLLAAGLISPWVGALIDRYGGRLILAAGNLLAGGMFLLWSVTSRLPAFYVICLGIGAAQAMTLYDAGFAILVRELRSNAPRAITVMTLVAGFASTIFLPLTGTVIDRFGWREALLLLAAVNVLIAAPANFALLRRSRASAFAHHERLRLKAIASQSLRSSSFRILFAVFAAWGFVFSALTMHIVPLLVDRGLPMSRIIWLLALIGPAQVGARLIAHLFPVLTTARWLGRFATVGLAVAMGLLAAAGGSEIWLAGFFILYGVSNGAFTIARGLAISEYVSVASFGATAGLLAVATGISMAGAPTTIGIIRSSTGSYSAGVSLMLATAILAALLYWILSVRAKIADR